MTAATDVREATAGMAVGEAATAVAVTAVASAAAAGADAAAADAETATMEATAEAATLEAAAATLACGPLTAFDELIGEVRRLPMWGSARAAQAPTDVPCAFGEHAGRGIIMKRNTFAELGGGSEGACALVLPTSDETLVEDGRITIAGPDISSLTRGCVAPFAQIILVAGAGLTGASYQDLEDVQKVRDWVSGYQLRSTPGAVYARVSDEAAQAGFSLAHLGRALIELVRATDEQARAVEVLFVTSTPEDVRRFDPLRERWRNVAHDLRRVVMAASGIDIDCPSGGHCGACKDRGTCQEVRRIQALRSKS